MTGSERLGLSGAYLGDNHVSADDYRDVSGIHLVDPVNKKKYFVVTDAEKKCLCSKGIADVETGGKLNLWAKFPAPPPDVTKVTAPAEITFRAAAVVPPMVLSVAPLWISTSYWVFPTATVPVISVPTKLPITTLNDVPVPPLGDDGQVLHDVVLDRAALQKLQTPSAPNQQ